MARSNQAASVDAAALASIGHNNPPSPIEVVMHTLKDAQLTPVDLLKHALAATHGFEILKVIPLADRANNAPATIANDDDLKLWAEIGRDASKLYKSLDEKRKDEKRPVVAAVDGYFEDPIARADRISTAAVQKATAYNKKKADDARKAQEAEAQRLRDEADAARIAAEFAIDEAPAVIAEGKAAALEIRAEMAAEPQSTADLTRVKTDSGVTATTARSWNFEIVDASKIDLNAIRMFIDPKAIETAIRKIVKTQKGATKIEGVRVFEDETAQFRG